MTTGSPRSPRIWIGAFTFALALAGCIDEAPPPADVPRAPAPLEEVASTPPAPGMVWYPGCWHWDGSGFVWLPGHWDSPPVTAPATNQPE